MKDKLTSYIIDSIVTRANNLSPTAQPLWGTMSVNAMLFHCSLINNQILNQTKTIKTVFKHRLMKPVFYALKKMPKGIKTGSKYLPPQADALIFQNELSNYIATMNRFKNSGKIVGTHPMFGPLNTNEWRKFVWLHMDHHLRQFGV